MKITNKGQRSAKKCEARIEKVVYNKTVTDWYHPTALKWSGESKYEPVEIPPGSHFFLDLFRINDLNVANAPWTLWIDNPDGRGLKVSYPSSGEYTIHIFLTEDTIKPRKGIIYLAWEGHPAQEPNVGVKWDKKTIKSAPYDRLRTLGSPTTTSHPSSGATQTAP